MRFLLGALLGSAQAATDGVNLALACPELAAQCTVGFAAPDFSCMLKADVSKLGPGACQDALNAYLATSGAPRDRDRPRNQFVDVNRQGKAISRNERVPGFPPKKMGRDMKRGRPQNDDDDDDDDSSEDERRDRFPRSIWRSNVTEWQHNWTNPGNQTWEKHSRPDNFPQSWKGRDRDEMREGNWRGGNVDRSETPRGNPWDRQRERGPPGQMEEPEVNTARAIGKRNATRRQADWQVGANMSKWWRDREVNATQKWFPAPWKKESNSSQERDSKWAVKLKAHFGSKRAHEDKRTYKPHFKNAKEGSWRGKVKAHLTRSDRSENERSSWEERELRERFDDQDDDESGKNAKSKKRHFTHGKKKAFTRAVEKIVQRMQSRGIPKAKSRFPSQAQESTPVDTIVSTDTSTPIVELPSPPPADFVRPLSFAPVEIAATTEATEETPSQADSDNADNSESDNADNSESDNAV